MEAYRGRNSQDSRPNLLLPISFGVSSTVLLHVLHQQLQRQKANSQGRTAYKICVLYVNQSSIASSAPGADLLKTLEEAYPGRTYTATTIESIFRHREQVDEVVSNLKLDPSTLQCLESDSERLNHLLNSLPSATARSDFLSLTLRRLIVTCAIESGCDGILWGDSNGTLAAKALSETAKGRGFSLPWQVSDGPSPFGIYFTYPLRDMNKSELVLYSSLQDGVMNSIIAPDAKYELSASAKSTSIDGLIAQYVESQGARYPNIIANVVRTASKLQAPTPGQPPCSLCGMLMPIETDKAPERIDEKATKKGGIHSNNDHDSVLCAGCIQLRS